MNPIDKARNDVRNLLTKIRVAPTTKMAFQPAPPPAPPAGAPPPQGGGAPPPPGAGAPPPQLPPEIADFLMQQGIDPNTIPPDQLPGVIQQVQQMMAQGGGAPPPGAGAPPPPGAGGPPPPPGPEAGGPPPPDGGALPPELVANLDQLSQAVNQLMQTVQAQGDELKGFIQQHNQEHNKLNAQMAKSEARFETALKFLKQPNEFNS